MPAGGHHFLGKGLGSLDPGGGRVRPEGRDPGGAQRVGDAGHERRFRPDHDEVGRDLPRHPHDVLRVAGGDGGATAPAAAMPGFPGAQWSSLTAGSAASPRTIACSLPPPPITSTRTLREPTGKGPFAREEGTRAAEAIRRGCPRRRRRPAGYVSRCRLAGLAGAAPASGAEQRRSDHVAGLALPADVTRDRHRAAGRPSRGRKWWTRGGKGSVLTVRGCCSTGTGPEAASTPS